MTDNEILLAMSNLLEPLKNNIQDIRSDIQDLRSDVQDLRSDVQDIKTRVTKIELTQENNIIPRLQNIEACYTSTYNRYKDSVEDYEVMKQDISMLKKVVAEHSEKIKKIS